MIKLNLLFGLSFKRTVHTSMRLFHGKSVGSEHMSAWIIYHYGDNKQITLSNSLKIPVIHSPKDVLIKISASSVNPIDIRRREGYGDKLINAYQSTKYNILRGDKELQSLNFPLILGRDFCGEIIRKGAQVTKFNVGDKVYGALNITRQGSFAEYCVSHEDEICLKPINLSVEEAAALPLVSLTSWYAIRQFSGFNEQNSLGKRGLVLGSNGGVGHIAIQYLNNLQITTTGLCSVKSFDYMKQIGVEDVVDYKQTNWFDQLSQKPKYDIIFDTVGPRHYTYTQMSRLLNPGGTYVTIITPIFHNVDRYGFIRGFSRTASQAVKHTIQGFSNDTKFRWAVYKPDRHALNEIKQLVEQNKLKPQIDSRRFTFEQVPEAISHLESGNSNGKVVIKYD